MSDQVVSQDPSPITDEMKINAAKNEWGKTFMLGDRTFEIKDLGYFDYIDFVTLVKPLISVAAGALEMGSRDGEMKVDFNPANIDLDLLIKLAGKELPKLAWIVCRQSDKTIKQDDVAMLAKRPQRLVEVVLLQVLHNKMIEEFGSFFQRLTSLVTTMVPSMAAVAAPSEIQPQTTEEIPSSS